MRRPSYYVLLCVFACGAVYLLTGDTLQQQARAREQVQQAREPVSVRANQPPRTPPPASVLHGTVLDGLGYRIAGAEVAPLRGAAAARTDGDGAFRLDLAGPGPFDLRVQAGGFRPRHLRLPPVDDPAVIALEPAAPWDEPPVALPEPSQLFGEGFVRDAEGRPVAHAMVTVVETGAAARADGVGRYRIPVPATGASLLASADDGSERGLAARSERIAFARSQGLEPLPDLRLQPAAAVRGMVRMPDGQPVTGVPLRLCGEGLVRVVESGADGVFHIAGLLAGSYQLATTPWRGLLPGRADVTLALPVADCDLTLRPAASQRLRVVDEQGAPLASAWVATTVDGVRSAVARVDGDGFVAVHGDGQPDVAFEVRSGEKAALRRVLRRGTQGELVVAAP